MQLHIFIKFRSIQFITTSIVDVNVIAVVNFIIYSYGRNLIAFIKAEKMNSYLLLLCPLNVTYI
jgi:hypothetical protein